MIRDEYIMDRLHELSLTEQVEVLQKALDHLATSDSRNKMDNISFALGIPLFPKIKSIERIDGYTVTLLFDQGEERILDFKKVCTGKKRYPRLLLNDYDLFKRMTIKEHTLAWPELGEWSTDLDGKEVFDYYDIDPAVLYEHSDLIPA